MQLHKAYGCYQHIDNLEDLLDSKIQNYQIKYAGVRRCSKNDRYATYTNNTIRDYPSFAKMNTDLLQWEDKESHPWIAIININYSKKSINGMPDDSINNQLEEIETALLNELTDTEGYQHIGRSTINGIRSISMACHEYRKPSKVYYNIQNMYSNQFQISYVIYKDMYWETFSQFMLNDTN